MTQSPERQTLAHAIAAHTAAVEQVAQAEATLQKAHGFHSDLTSQYAAFENLDADIAKARAQNLKAALASGETLVIDEPSGFASKRVARDNLEDHIAQVRETLPVLEAELDYANVTATRLDIEREIAAEAVIAVEAEQLAVDFMNKLNALRREHYRLASYVNRWRKTPTGVTQVRMPSVVVGAAMENILGDSEARGGIRVREAIANAMTTYWNVLKTNPRAVLSDFECAEPSANVVTMPAKAKAS